MKGIWTIALTACSFYSPAYARDADAHTHRGYIPDTSYLPSMGVQLQSQVIYPSIIQLLTLRKQAFDEEIAKDPANKELLDPLYQPVADSLVFYQKAFGQLTASHAYETKKSREQAFIAWAQDKPAYRNTLRDWTTEYTHWTPYVKNLVYTNYGILGSPLMALAAKMMQLENALVRNNAGDPRKIMQSLQAARRDFLQTENKSADKKILAQVTQRYYQDIDKNQHPIGFFEKIKGSFGDLKLAGTYTKYAEAVFANTLIFDDAKWNAFVANPDATLLQEDPAYAQVSQFLRNWQGKYSFYQTQFQSASAAFEKTFLQGSLEMAPPKAVSGKKSN